MSQLTLNFEAGLLTQFPEFNQCVNAAVYGCGRPFKIVAADLNMSSTKLSRMLNDGDAGINFPLHLLPELLEATGDMRPLHWLAEKFGQDPAAARKQAIDRAVAMMAQLPDLIKVLQQAN